VRAKRRTANAVADYAEVVIVLMGIDGGVVNTHVGERTNQNQRLCL